MNKRNQMKPLARLIATSLAVGSMAGFGTQVLAATAAGTLIKNLATVTYEDANGNSYSAQSNEAVVTVAPVYFATVENDNSLFGAPGQTVYFPHTINNTGNIADTYDVEATAGTIYLDSNNNGQPDSGEQIITELTIAAGEQANLIVALPVPTTAANGSTLDSTLTVESTNSGKVSDVGDNADIATDDSSLTTGADSVPTSATNNDTVTVSTGPVLVLNKSSVLNEDLNEITYTLTVKNTGGADATNVNIVDALPQVDTDGSGTLSQVTLKAGSILINGLEDATDVSPTADETVSEADLGDLNFDGDTDDTALQAIVAKDVTLPVNTTVSVVYTVNYDPTWDAGAEVENTFVAFDDPDGDGKPSTNPTDTKASSNTTNDEIPQTYGISATDTDTGAEAGKNDGGDDDGDDDPLTNNDSQYVDVAATGGEVKFQHIITNNSNGEDAFNLNITNDPTNGFPDGTTFTYWDSTGTVQLTDSDDDGVPDTGSLDKDQATTIMVKAKLPAGVSDLDPEVPPAAGYNATLTATSSKDPSSTPEFDTTDLKLGSITAPTVDIAINYSGADTLASLVAGANQGDTGFNDDGVENAQDEEPAALLAASVNSEITVDLKLANESGGSDSFTLSADGVPAGWDVVFTTTDGSPITSTPLIAGGGEFAYKAVITVSADPAEAKSDAGSGVDGYDAVNDPATTPSNALSGDDGDDDYVIGFAATSSSTDTTSDVVKAAVDVATDREVVITPNGQNQIQPGGTVDYNHKLENNGNQGEVVELGATDNQSGWTTLINVDTNGDGIPDTILTSTMTEISGVDDEGNFVTIEVTDTDGDGIPELNLEPGENVNFTTTVAAPANAPLGTTDTSTLIATVTDAPTDPDPAAATTIASAQDSTTVILGQVRLEKTSAVDKDCLGTTLTPFLAEQTEAVAPGECVVWRLTATNEGSATVNNVVMSDAAPEFTTYETGSLKFCHGNACDPVTVSDDANDDQGTYSSGLIKFFASDVAPVPVEGGSLLPGQQATGEFKVKVE